MGIFSITSTTFSQYKNVGPLVILKIFATSAGPFWYFGNRCRYGGPSSALEVFTDPGRQAGIFVESFSIIYSIQVYMPVSYFGNFCSHHSPSRDLEMVVLGPGRDFLQYEKLIMIKGLEGF